MSIYNVNNLININNIRRLIIIFTVNILIMPFNTCWAADVLMLSTTTSTENSGLLSVLHPAFEKQTGIKVNVIAVGTGKALRIGGNGDVDVVFVHAPTTELKYVEQGDFIDRSAVMYNDFVIVGPDNDPAGIATANSVVDALTKIVEGQITFVSRGDDSGTHKKEKQLWELVGIKPKGEWYAAVGQGMGASLWIADEKQGYILTDRGTHIAYLDKTSLKVLYQGDPMLFNPYHVMAVNPEKYKHVRYDLAKQYIDFLVSEKGQSIISEYKKGGQQLFYPDGNK